MPEHNEPHPARTGPPRTDPVWRALRAVLFELDPERAHDMALAALEWPGVARLMGRHTPASTVQTMTCMGLSFANRVGLAAGLDKNGDHIDALAALGFGHVEVGTVTPRAQPGNPTPRMFRLEQHRALINRLGFNNKGVAHLVAQAERRRSTAVLGINIGKNATTPNERAADDYLFGLDRVWPVADYVTVNISSPNTANLRDLQHGDALRALLDTLADRAAALATRHGHDVPLAIKVAPDLDDAALDDLADAVAERPIAALIVGNTTRERARVASHLHAREAGGLSGAPLKPLADERLGAMRARLDQRRTDGHAVPELNGVGGIETGADAANKLALGATLVQLYTGFIYEGPALVASAIDRTREPIGDPAP